MAIFGQWQGCSSERGFSRSARRHLRAAFPPLPTRKQLHRQVRQHHEALVAGVRHVVHLLAAQRCAYAALESTGVPVREAQRRGAGWLPGVADIGGSNRLGWYEGFPLLLAVTPVGGIPGCGFGAASPTDQPLAAPCFALRRWPHPGRRSVGAPARGPYVVDKGFAGQAHHAVWWQPSGAQVLCPPKRKSKPPWPQALRRWVAGGRQSVETVDDQRFHPFRLDRERPHELSGFHARLAAKIAWHNFCIWVNEQLGRPRLACTDLVDWEIHAISHQAFKRDAPA